MLAGHRHVRINLSEQTDMMDLLGADLPVEGGLPAEFAWADGPLLAALKAGDWVLLDELNLAGAHPADVVFLQTVYAALLDDVNRRPAPGSAAPWYRFSEPLPKWL